MSRFFLVLVGIIFLLGINIISAAEIGYVIQTPYPINSDEAAIIDLLEDNGHSVTFLDDVAFDTLNYDLIIVGKDVPNIEWIFNNANIETLFLSQSAAKNAGVSVYSGTTSGYNIIISDNEHIITQEFNLGNLKIYDNQESLGYLYGCKATGAKDLAYKSESYRSSILLLKKGSLLIDSGCSDRDIEIFERNIFFGMPIANEWTLNTKTLFLNSIDWAIYGEDHDSDEIRDELDNCINDYNPNQDDNDDDGLGDVCDVCPFDEDNDIDQDNVCGDIDNCINVYNTGQEDSDEDSFGDSCDEDIDGDGVENIADSCKFTKLEENVNLEGCADYQLIVINEFESNPKEGNEWVELYNPGSSDVDISGFNLFDGLVSPSLKYTVPQGVVLSNNGYYVFNVSGLNNGGEFLTLYDASNYLIDETPTLIDSVSGGDVKTWQRKPNGVDSDEVSNWNFQINTKNMNNDVDVDTPILDSIGDKMVAESSLLEFVVHGEDIGEEIINLSAIGLPNGASFSRVSAEGDVEQTFSWTPTYEQTGTYEIEFVISDGILEDRETITIMVNNVNRAPTLNALANQSMSEDDDMVEVILTATDLDGDELIFLISEENINEVDCNIDENNLTITPAGDWNGDASCTIQVSDGDLIDEQIINIYVGPINDIPNIIDYSPKGIIKLMENTGEEFSVIVNDVDNPVVITWFLDDVEVGIGDKYDFNQLKGNYHLNVSISDGEVNVSHLWDVVVGDISDFRCEQVGGFVLNEHESCLGSLLGVYDIDNCCSIPASFGFNDVGRCEVINNEIEITIKDPDEGDEFGPGDLIKGKLKLKNDFDEDRDFDIEVYLYDMTDDKDIEEYTDSIKNLDEGTKESIEFEIQIPKNLDVKNNYALFVKVIEEDDEYCNNEFIEISIEREEDNLIFEEIEINPEIIGCGEYIEIKTKIKNLGDEDQEAYVIIENSELNISQKSELFEIEEYDEDDEWVEIFDLMIHEGINIGGYELEISLIFADKEVLETKEIIVGECKILEQKINNVGQIELGINNGEAQVKDNSKIYLIVGSIAVILLLILIILMILFMI